MAAPDSDDVLELPMDIITSHCGLGLDIGGSVAKVVYRSNKEYKEGIPLEKKTSSSATGKLHLASFPRDDNDKLIKCIKDNCDLKRNKDGETVVYGCGLGCSQFKANLEKELQIKLRVIGEYDFFAGAFVQLSKVLPKEELVFPSSPEAQAQADRMKQMFQGILAKAKETGSMSATLLEPGKDETGSKETSEKEEKEKGMLPCVIAMCGSASCLMLVNKDGSVNMIETLTMGGRFFLGMMNHLTGVKDFSKLMEMVGKGDGRSVDIFMSDMQRDKGQEDVYSMVEFDMSLFPFGKALTEKKDDMTPEDMAQSLYSCLAFSHVHAAHMAAALLKIKHVYFCGNFVNAPEARYHLEKHHQKRMIMIPPENHAEIHFLRHSGMYGAIGAYFHTPKE